MTCELPKGIRPVELEDLDDAPETRFELDAMARSLPPGSEIVIYRRIADGELRYAFCKAGTFPRREEIEQLFSVLH